MNIFITLDYELFFGTKSGTANNCIINPTDRLLKVTDKYNVKCVFFVDAGYLVKLKELSKKFKTLLKDYELVSTQIRKLADNGHEIQLHIHPHWEDAIFDGESWSFDLTRYRLDAFNENEVLDIFFNYKSILEEISGKSIFAYRAGGWCIQPFPLIKKAMIKNKICIDSTIYYKGKNVTPAQWFDFSKTKDLDTWRFEDDPCIENKKGTFLEVPIAYKKLSPLFFWKFAIMKKIGGAKHKSFGDGFASPRFKKHIIKLLLKNSFSVVSIDGYKTNFLRKAYFYYKKQKKNNFVMIGHPKAFTEYSLSKLDKFLNGVLDKDDKVVTFSCYKKESKINE